MENTNITAIAIFNEKEQPPRLTVTGTIFTPTSKDKIIIKKAVPQGINPTILLLDLEVKVAEAPMKMTPKRFNYENSSKEAGSYKQVTINDINESENSITVDVLYEG